jgi:hypothetical protein
MSEANGRRADVLAVDKALEKSRELLKLPKRITLTAFA